MTTDMNVINVQVSKLFNDSSIYIIPTFQRPYAWEDNQWDDFIEDIRTATRRNNAYHYFAPLHVIRIDGPEDDFWKNYTDPSNIDISELRKNKFRNINYQELSVYLVIDGQQRLITFYSLLYQYNNVNIHLNNNHQIPNIILSSESDQVFFRNLLGLSSLNRTVYHVSRSQNRLDDLFSKFNDITSSDPCFQCGGLCHKFYLGNKCQTLLVILNPTIRIAAFMTLNDRGKALTTLEKTKSLFMEIDDNHHTPNPYSINNAFGNLYLSLEIDDSYISDDEALRQIGMTLWEGKNLTEISGFTWYPTNNYDRSNYIHQIGADLLYEEYFKKIIHNSGNIPLHVAGDYLHNCIIPYINKIADCHKEMSTKIRESIDRSLLNCSSFVQKIGLKSRDAIEDYYAVLLSLGLQSKQIGFLLAVRNLFPSLAWHDTLGTIQVDNRYIKKELHSILDNIIRDNNIIKNIDYLVELFSTDIDNIPDFIERKYTSLQLAESLRLFIGNSKPGGFSSTWNNTFNANRNLTPQEFLNSWYNYVIS